MSRLARRTALRAVETDLSPEVAVELLFRRHYAALLRLAWAMLGDREAAEDAVQDSYVSLYRHWDRLRDPQSAGSYLRSAVINRCRSGVRALVRDRRLAALHDRPLHVVGSDDSAAVREEHELLGRALRQLPRRQREVVACRYLLELSVAETAETLGISEGAVKTHAHRGLQSLHTALEVTR